MSYLSDESWLELLDSNQQIEDDFINDEQLLNNILWV
jgi:hypothetical protein